MSCQITFLRAGKTYATSAATQDMATFNLCVELCQSSFYPKDRERDLPPLMEFKDCSLSDKESWEMSDRAGYEVRKGMYIATRVLVCCLKRYLLHLPVTHCHCFPCSGLWLLIDRAVRMWKRCSKASPNQSYRVTGGVRPGSYLWEMTVCKYLNLWKGTRGDNEDCREIGGVSSQHLFHQAFSNEVRFPRQHGVIGGYVIAHPQNLLCINVSFYCKSTQKNCRMAFRENLNSWVVLLSKWCWIIQPAKVLVSVCKWVFCPFKVDSSRF